MAGRARPISAARHPLPMSAGPSPNTSPRTSLLCITLTLTLLAITARRSSSTDRRRGHGRRYTLPIETSFYQWYVQLSRAADLFEIGNPYLDTRGPESVSRQKYV